MLCNKESGQKNQRRRNGTMATKTKIVIITKLDHASQTANKWMSERTNTETNKQMANTNEKYSHQAIAFLQHSENRKCIQVHRWFQQHYRLPGKQKNVRNTTVYTNLKIRTHRITKAAKNLKRLRGLNSPFELSAKACDVRTKSLYFFRLKEWHYNNWEKLLNKLSWSEAQDQLSTDLQCWRWTKYPG